MKLTTSVALLAAAGAQAHYTFPQTDINGQLSGEWVTIRETTNHYSHGPVTDVTSDQIRCYELNPGTPAPQIATVQAGGTVTFTVDPSIQHPGPLQFYMAKAPSGQTAATFQGTGNVWFKIYEDGPSGLGTSNITWPSSGKTEVSVKIPSCIAPGDYLLRVEHIALHSASTVGGAQFYLACAQLTVTGGTGTLNTGELVAFPGAYSATDPGILFQLYWPIPTSYTNPGPAPVSC
ncbi:8d7f3242-1f91-4346-b7af-e6c1127ffff5 [Thermothielavioides terrestris]|uniref:AA9 family lytic polysaccharide monooxygenase A n=2 Tax=Thermothielavioides terrestris TaxID=2587410 RepID=LP9A_THETT|nr:glycoside hydrolase family 61 protein [Thermothielavioides terrestris NRRL 8126]AEO67662.1 glycoside hydrolase family 61 protein [Thermothielavioides terrestris NRRL 8126]SPQ25791.1 8d7f3242-1f91-4346-b7af-e6c1127ffff5 [Thermothielavioides terrestris]